MKILNRKHRLVQNMRPFLLLGSLLVVGLQVFASEEAAESVAPKNIIYNQQFDLKNNRGRLNVLVHSDGHSNGRGFVVELRPDCHRRARPWQELELRDMEAQCFVDVKSLQFNQANETVTFEGFEMDYDLHEKNMQKDPPETSVSCDLKTKKTFTLKTNSLCKKRTGRSNSR